MSDLQYFFLLAIFLLAGLVKGVTGMGLPTVAIGLLGLLMPVPQAAAVLIIPSLVTNLIQLLAGGALAGLIKRLWPMMACSAGGTLAGAHLLLAGSADAAACALGAVLFGYALFTLLSTGFSTSASAEKWLSPAIGLTTGAITGATGVFVVPAVPYLQSLSLPKEALVQALGLSFTVSTLALAAGLYLHGGWKIEQSLSSILALPPAIVGMWIGQKIRSRLSPTLFRRCFLTLLMALGLEIGLRPLF